jgi:hypothetical protein
MLAQREAQAPWGSLLEQALTAPAGRFGKRGRKTAATQATGSADDQAA